MYADKGSDEELSSCGGSDCKSQLPGEFQLPGNDKVPRVWDILRLLFGYYFS